jgi:dihydroxy-acid dehydratase
MIEIDIPRRTLNVQLSEDELDRRKQQWVCPEPKVEKGYLIRYARSVTSASYGAVVK